MKFKVKQAKRVVTLIKKRIITARKTMKIVVRKVNIIKVSCKKIGGGSLCPCALVKKYKAIA